MDVHEYSRIQVNIRPYKYQRRLEDGESPVTVSFYLTVTRDLWSKHGGAEKPAFYPGTFNPISESLIYEAKVDYRGNELDEKRVLATFSSFMTMQRAILEKVFPKISESEWEDVYDEENANERNLIAALHHVYESRGNVAARTVVSAKQDVYVWADDGYAFGGVGHTTYSRQPIEPARLAQSIQDQHKALIQVVKHPETGKEMSLSNAIVNLNDEFKWPFDKIADWMDTLDINTTICSRKELT